MFIIQNTKLDEAGITFLNSTLPNYVGRWSFHFQFLFHTVKSRVFLGSDLPRKTSMFYATRLSLVCIKVKMALQWMWRFRTEVLLKHSMLLVRMDHVPRFVPGTPFWDLNSNSVYSRYAVSWILNSKTLTPASPMMMIPPPPPPSIYFLPTFTLTSHFLNLFLGMRYPSNWTNLSYSFLFLRKRTPQLNLRFPGGSNSSHLPADRSHRDIPPYTTSNSW